MSSTEPPPPGLDKVVAAVGPQLFSYLPTGSLLRGSSSPMLVNRTFHEGVFQCLGQTATLDLSCRHLRRVDDEQLFGLIEKIVEVGEASKAGHGGNDHGSIKVACLDLSRCQYLRGEGVYYALKHMPDVQRILLSSAARFDAYHRFANDLACSCLDLSKLQYTDFSGCSLFDSNAMKAFLVAAPGWNLRHLNLGGASAQLNDKGVISVGVYCPNLESLSLAGAKKVTQVGVGIVSYLCGGTLKSLNLRGCEGVHLPMLLMGAAFDIILLIRDHGPNNPRGIAPPNFVGDPENVATNVWLAAISSSVTGMMQAHDGNMHSMIRLSRRYREEAERAEESANAIFPGERRKGTLFGVLEHLDISLIGTSSIRLDGCLATIAWLSGGRLKQVEAVGLDSVLRSDLAALACTSQHRLQSLSAPSSATMSPSDYHSLWSFCYGIQHVRELDLSCCDFELKVGSDGGLMAAMRNLRSLRLDHTNIEGRLLQSFMEHSLGLLQLSVRGCANLSTSFLSSLDEQLGLLDLDCRDINKDAPLAAVRAACPHLLRLNQRCTSLGTKMLKAHRLSFLWRIGSNEGAENKSRKRGRSGEAIPSASADSDAEADTPFNVNSCTILSTGFSSTRDTEQEMYACRTCFVGFNRFVCLPCVTKCHQGHDVISVGTGCGFCDCSLFAPCQCLDRDFNEDALSSNGGDERPFEEWLVDNLRGRDS